MWVFVTGFDKDQEDMILIALDKLGFGDIPSDDGCIAVEGTDKLIVSPTSCDFAREVTHSVWLANDSYCEVEVQAVCRDCPEGDSFSFFDDEYTDFLRELTVWGAVRDFDEDQKDAIVLAVQETAGFDCDISKHGIEFTRNANLQLCPPIACLMEKIVHSVWIVNRNYCDVEVYAETPTCSREPYSPSRYEYNATF